MAPSCGFWVKTSEFVGKISNSPSNPPPLEPRNTDSCKQPQVPNRTTAMGPVTTARASRRKKSLQNWTTETCNLGVFLAEDVFCYQFFGEVNWGQLDKKIMAAMRYMSCEKKSAVSNILVRGQYWVIASGILPAQHLYMFLYMLHISYLQNGDVGTQRFVRILTQLSHIHVLHEKQ